MSGVDSEKKRENVPYRGKRLKRRMISLFVGGVASILGNFILPPSESVALAEENTHTTSINSRSETVLTAEQIVQEEKLYENDSIEERVKKAMFLDVPETNGASFIFSSAAELDPTNSQFSTADNYQWGGPRGYKDPYSGQFKPYEMVEVDGEKYVEVVPDLGKTRLESLNFTYLPKEGMDFSNLPDQGKIIIFLGGQEVLKSTLADLMTGKSYPVLKEMGLLPSHTDHNKGGGFAIRLPIQGRIRILMQKPAWFDATVNFLSDTAREDAPEEVKTFFTQGFSLDVNKAIKRFYNSPLEKIELADGERATQKIAPETKLVSGEDAGVVNAVQFKINETQLNEFLTTSKLEISYGAEKGPVILDLNDLFGFQNKKIEAENQLKELTDDENQYSSTSDYEVVKNGDEEVISYINNNQYFSFLDYGIVKKEDGSVIIYINYPLVIPKGGSLAFKTGQGSSGTIEMKFEKRDLTGLPKLQVLKISSHGSSTPQYDFGVLGNSQLVREVTSLTYGAAEQNDGSTPELNWTLAPLEANPGVKIVDSNGVVYLSTGTGAEERNSASGFHMITPGDLSIHTALRPMSAANTFGGTIWYSRKESTHTDSEDVIYKTGRLPTREAAAISLNATLSSPPGGMLLLQNPYVASFDSEIREKFTVDINSVYIFYNADSAIFIPQDKIASLNELQLRIKNISGNDNKTMSLVFQKLLGELSVSEISALTTLSDEELTTQIIDYYRDTLAKNNPQIEKLMQSILKYTNAELNQSILLFMQLDTISTDEDPHLIALTDAIFSKLITAQTEGKYVIETEQITNRLIAVLSSTETEKKVYCLEQLYKLINEDPQLFLEKGTLRDILFFYPLPSSSDLWSSKYPLEMFKIAYEGVLNADFTGMEKQDLHIKDISQSVFDAYVEWIEYLHELGVVSVPRLFDFSFFVLVFKDSTFNWNDQDEDVFKSFFLAHDLFAQQTGIEDLETYLDFISKAAKKVAMSYLYSQRPTNLTSQLYFWLQVKPLQKDQKTEEMVDSFFITDDFALSMDEQSYLVNFINSDRNERTKNLFKKLMNFDNKKENNESLNWGQLVRLIQMSDLFKDDEDFTELLENAFKNPSNMNYYPTLDCTAISLPVLESTDPKYIKEYFTKLGKLSSFDEKFHFSQYIETKGQIKSNAKHTEELLEIVDKFYNIMPSNAWQVSINMVEIDSFFDGVTNEEDRRSMVELILQAAKSASNFNTSFRSLISLIKVKMDSLSTLSLSERFVVIQDYLNLFSNLESVGIPVSPYNMGVEEEFDSDREMFIRKLLHIAMQNEQQDPYDLYFLSRFIEDGSKLSESDFEMIDNVRTKLRETKLYEPMMLQNLMLKVFDLAEEDRTAEMAEYLFALNSLPDQSAVDAVVRYIAEVPGQDELLTPERMKLAEILLTSPHDIDALLKQLEQILGDTSTSSEHEEEGYLTTQKGENGAFKIVVRPSYYDDQLKKSYRVLKEAQERGIAKEITDAFTVVLSLADLRLNVRGVGSDAVIPFTTALIYKMHQGEDPRELVKSLQNASDYFSGSNRISIDPGYANEFWQIISKNPYFFNDMTSISKALEEFYSINRRKADPLTGFQLQGVE